MYSQFLFLLCMPEYFHYLILLSSISFLISNQPRINNQRKLSAIFASVDCTRNTPSSWEMKHLCMSNVKTQSSDVLLKPVCLTDCWYFQKRMHPWLMKLPGSERNYQWYIQSFMPSFNSRKLKWHGERWKLRPTGTTNFGWFQIEYFDPDHTIELVISFHIRIVRGWSFDRAFLPLRWEVSLWY